MKKSKFLPAFSLLEMLVSLTIGSLILAVIYQVSIQLNFSFERKKDSVVNDLQTLGSYKTLYLLFDNAGLYVEGGDPIQSESNNKELVITYKGSSNCFSRADADGEIGVYYIKTPDNQSNGIYCLETKNGEANENGLIIEDAQIQSIRYMIEQSDSRSVWISEPSTNEAKSVKGIYFKYEKDGKNYGLFSAFNTRN